MDTEYHDEGDDVRIRELSRAEITAKIEKAMGLGARTEHARIAELEAERDALRAKVKRLTVDCDEYEFRDGRCYEYEDGTICPREPGCHDRDGQPR